MENGLKKQHDEARHRMRRLQVVVDLACAAVRSGTYSRAECEEFLAAARKTAAQLCPDRLDLFEMIYARRLERLITEFVREKEPPPPNWETRE